MSSFSCWRFSAAAADTIQIAARSRFPELQDIGERYLDGVSFRKGHQ